MVQDWYCSQTFSGRDLPGNDLTNKLGQWSDCCDFCRANSACKAVTWTNANGGTCWLKSAVGYMVSDSNSQAAIILPDGVWTDGTAVNFFNWAVIGPNNAYGVEVCVNIYSSTTTDCSGVSGGYSARRGFWNDIDPNGSFCDVYAAVCEIQCTAAQFPIDDSCPYTTNQITIVAKAMTQPNFNSGFLPIVMASYPNDYTRLGPPYGRCIRDKSEVKSFYSAGVYNIDSCFDSCYQDYVYETCGCMDPRFISEPNVTLCNLTLIGCFMGITEMYGESSTWPECDCPQPCNETKYVVSWSKTVFRTTPTECNPNNQTTFTNCTARYQDEYAMFNAYVPAYGHYVFAETPEYTLQDILNSFNNLTGLLLGVSIVSFFEIISLIANLSYVLCMKAPANEQHTHP
uniref:Apple domain-containing protein n=1 Tax=Acrobeloides nanus TaxID=290746 RepID=A0A914END6_9BILA